MKTTSLHPSPAARAAASPTALALELPVTARTAWSMIQDRSRQFARHGDPFPGSKQALREPSGDVVNGILVPTLAEDIAHSPPDRLLDRVERLALHAGAADGARPLLGDAQEQALHQALQVCQQRRATLAHLPTFDPTREAFELLHRHLLDTRLAADHQRFRATAELPTLPVLARLQAVAQLSPAPLEHDDAADSEGLHRFAVQSGEQCRQLLRGLSARDARESALPLDERIQQELRGALPQLLAFRDHCGEAAVREALERLHEDARQLLEHLAPATPPAAAADAERRSIPGEWPEAADDDAQLPLPVTAPRPQQGRTLLSRLGAVWDHKGEHAQHLWHQTDLYGAITRRDDLAFKHELRVTRSAEVDGWIAHTQEMRHLVERAGLPKRARKELVQALNGLGADLSALKNGVPLGERAWRCAATLAAYPVPLAVAFVTHEKEYSSTLIPHFIKNLLLLGGLFANDSTDHRTVVQHAKNRLFVNGVVAGLYAGPAFIHALKPWHESTAFSVGAGLISGLATYTMFNQEKTHNALHKVVDTLKSLVFAQDDARVVIREDAKAELKRYIGELRNDKHAFAGIEQHFREQLGKGLSDTVNSQVERALTGMDQVVSKACALTGEDDPEADARRGSVQDQGTEAAARRGDTPDHDPEAAARRGDTQHHDPDRASKLGLTGFTGAICSGVVALMSNNPVGMVDYIVDGAWCFDEMRKQAMNHNVKMQGAVQTFKDLVGLNLTMIAYLSINRGYDFLHKDAGQYAAGTAAMTVANLALPGIVGGAAGKGAGVLLTKTTAAANDAWRYLNDQVHQRFGLAPAAQGQDVVLNALSRDRGVFAAGPDLEAQPVRRAVTDEARRGSTAGPAALTDPRLPDV